MALTDSPPTRDKTYVDGVSQIAAVEMNDIQDLEIALATGTRSIKAITVDGTGGASTPSAVAGAVAVSATKSGTSTPNTTVAKGTVCADNQIVAWAKITNNGTTAAIARGFNIASVTRTGTGAITITLNVNGLAIDGVIPMAMAIQVPGRGVAVDVTAISPITLSVSTFLTSTGAAADFNFFIQVIAA